MCERNDVEGRFESDKVDFVDVGSLKRLPSGTTTPVTVGVEIFTLVHVDGRVIAVGDLCLRCGRSLSAASFAEGLLTCRGCGWKYDVHRGCVDGLPRLRIETHEVCVRDGRLLLASDVAASAPQP